MCVKIVYNGTEANTTTGKITRIMINLGNIRGKLTMLHMIYRLGNSLNEMQVCVPNLFGHCILRCSITFK